MPTIREIFTNGPFKIFVSASLLVLDSNRVARASRVFKIGIEHELVISVEGHVFIKNKYRTFTNYLTKNSPIALVSNKINSLPASFTLKNCKLEPMEMIKKPRLTTHCPVMRAVSAIVTITREVLKLSELP